MEGRRWKRCSPEGKHQNQKEISRCHSSDCDKNNRNLGFFYETGKEKDMDYLLESSEGQACLYLDVSRMEAILDCQCQSYKNVFIGFFYHSTAVTGNNAIMSNESET